MKDNITMHGKDALSAKLAECFVTINGSRYNFMHMTEFEAKIEKEKVEVPILGRLQSGNKTVGLKGSFTGKAYYNTSILRRALLDYKDTGEDLYFEIQVTNEDPTSRAGRQTVVLLDCNVDSMTLVKFSAGSELLEEDMEGTFEDWKMPEEFDLLEGMM